MGNIDFQQIFATLKSGVIDLAQKTGKEYADQATEDGKRILETMKEDLALWAQQLKNGQITPEELEFLLGTKEAVMKMVALKQAGLAQIQIDKFKDGLTSLITQTLSAVI